MTAHVLLNLLKELGKRDKMRGLPSIFITFCTTLINLEIQQHKCYILFIIRHQNYFKITFFGVIMSRFSHLLRNVIMDAIT